MQLYDTIIDAGARLVTRLPERRIAAAGPLGRPLAEPVAADAPAVVLVHGYGATSASTSAYERSLRRDGFRVTSLDLPDHGVGDVAVDGRYVMDRVRRFRADVGSAPVTVVAHSRGGLVARYAAQLLDTGGDIGRVVTIGSANTGVGFGVLDRVVRPFLPAGVAQTMHGSDLVRELAATRSRVDLVAAGTIGYDGFLTPPASARIPGAPFLELDAGRRIGPLSRVGHFEALRDDASYEAVRGALLT
jgi:pimeloyl-ACP methyl ester carboxylesterase